MAWLSGSKEDPFAGAAQAKAQLRSLKKRKMCTIFALFACGD
jgi:hypothetical protein